MGGAEGGGVDAQVSVSHGTAPLDRSVRRDESNDQLRHGVALVPWVGAATAQQASSSGHSVVEHVAVAHRGDHHMRRAGWRCGCEVFVVHRRRGTSTSEAGADDERPGGEPCRIGRRRQGGRMSSRAVDRIDDDDTVGIDLFGDPPGDLATAGVTGEPHLVRSTGGHDVFDDPDSLLGLLAR